MSPLQVAKSSGELAFVPCIPMLRDCPLCLLGNSQAAPSYRWSIWQAVGDLPLSSGSEGGGEGHSGHNIFNFFLCPISLLPLPNVPLWPPGPWTPELRALSRSLKQGGGGKVTGDVTYSTAFL